MTTATKAQQQSCALWKAFSDTLNLYDKRVRQLKYEAGVRSNDLQRQWRIEQQREERQS